MKRLKGCSLCASCLGLCGRIKDALQAVGAAPNNSKKNDDEKEIIRLQNELSANNVKDGEGVDSRQITPNLLQNASSMGVSLCTAENAMTTSSSTRGSPAKGGLKRSFHVLDNNCPDYNHSVSKKQFCEGVVTIHKMSFAEFYETRKEASLMLCDLSSKPENYLALQGVCEHIVFACQHLLKDEFDDIVESAVMALSELVEMRLYLEGLSVSPSILGCLMGFVRRSMTETMSYKTAQLHRQAAFILSRVAALFPMATLLQLQLCGFVEENSWQKEVARIEDERTRNYAAELGSFSFRVSSGNNNVKDVATCLAGDLSGIAKA